MVNSTPTPSASTALIPTPNPQQLAARVAPPDAIPHTAATMLQHDIAALCADVLWLRSWWASYRQVIAAAAPQVASSGNDHIVMAAGTARAVLRQLGMDVNEGAMASHQWPDAQGKRHAACETDGGEA